jgi:hypothetical protein
MTREVKPRHKYAKSSFPRPGTDHTVTGDETEAVTMKEEAETPQVEAPAPSTLMPHLSREDRKMTDQMTTLRKTVKRSNNGPNGSCEDTIRVPRSTPGIPNLGRPQ